MARALLSLLLGAALMLPGTAVARTPAGRHPDAAAAAQQRVAARRAALQRLTSREPVVLATAVAKRYWNAVPCGGDVTVRANQPLAAGLDSTTDGWVTFNSALGANDLQAPAASYTNCTISLAHWQWPTRAEMKADWNMLCLTVIHEMGHLLGHVHSPVPGSVMAPEFTDEANVPAICRATRPGGASAARLLAH